MWETWLRSLGWEDPLEKGKATHSRILAWRIPWTTVHGFAKSWTGLSNFHFTSLHSKACAKDVAQHHLEFSGNVKPKATRTWYLVPITGPTQV